MRRLLTALLCTQLVAGSAFAHDFWLKPEKFRVEGPGPVDVVAEVGHAEDIEEWPADLGRVTGLRLIGENGITDVQAALASRQSRGRFEINLPQTGVYVLALESTKAVSDLPAKAFNDYVREEGLTPIAQDRLDRGRTNSRGREVYSRRAKTILVSGPLDDAGGDEHALRPIGLTLEITPLTLPARLEPGADFPVEVRFRGSPLQGATIRLIKLGEDGGETGRWTTEDDGQVTVPHPGPGNWMLHTIWASEALGDARADYDTVFSSLSFSIDGTAP